MLPLLVIVPSPLRSITNPPEWTALRPDAATTLFPLPLLPLPTPMRAVPPEPAVAVPDAKTSDALLAKAVMPELNARRPVDPGVAPFAVKRHTLPVLEDVPSPVVNERDPPVDAVLAPSTRLIRPPAPLVPLPTVT